MPNAANPGPEAVPAPHKPAPEAAFDPAEASENAEPAPAGRAAPPPLLPPLGAGLRSIPPQAPEPSEPKRRPSANPGNRAEASPGDASGSTSAGAPSRAQPEFAGAAAAGR